MSLCKCPPVHINITFYVHIYSFIYMYMYLACTHMQISIVDINASNISNGTLSLPMTTSAANHQNRIKHNRELAMTIPWSVPVFSPIGRRPEFYQESWSLVSEFLLTEEKHPSHQILPLASVNKSYMGVRVCCRVPSVTQHQTKTQSTTKSAKQRAHLTREAYRLWW